jgi:hypothetical protein
MLLESEPASGEGETGSDEPNPNAHIFRGNGVRHLRLSFGPMCKAL